MEKKVRRREGSAKPRWARSAEVFPETETAVLVQAAAGDWERFFRSYLSACWREIALACRARNLPLTEMDDLLQELVVRLLKSGQSRQQGVVGERGNVPDRFLKQRGAGPGRAQFRTVLKRVIENLVLEQLRRQRRAPRPLGIDGQDLDLWIEESVGKIIDQQWVAVSLTQAARQLMMESLNAPTRGKRRWFLVLYFALARQQTAAASAEHFGLDRTNVAGLLTQARQRFVAILQEITGIASTSELKDRLASQPEKLLESLETVYVEYLSAAAEKGSKLAR